jgi:phospholipid/cholesterol/gamma-HCH transport system permease protein
MLPAAIMYSIVHEMGPIVTALVVSGRVGAGIGAELGAMRVTEQIDAIEASAVNPYKLLAFSRILACIVVLPLLTLVADFSGVVAAWITATLADPIAFQHFLNKGLSGVTVSDFLAPTLRT